MNLVLEQAKIAARPRRVLGILTLNFRHLEEGTEEELKLERAV